MKLLKRMLLINWHYINKQMIEFSNINFLTGKNGAGKSTILDAIQLLMLGDTRGTFFNKAANDKAGRSLEGYLRGEMGDDGDVGYKYKRDGRFSSYIVCEFYDYEKRKYFQLGVMFDLYKDSETEGHFFMVDDKIPDNQYIENNIPFSFKELKSFLARKYGTKKFDIYSSNRQYQDAMRGKLGGLNLKFFNLFKKAVTFTPIDDIEKFIVEYVCDVKNKIDITSMQENIRQYNNLLRQVEIMRNKEKQLEQIENTFNRYVNDLSNVREEQFLIWRAEKQILLQDVENIKKNIANKKIEKETIEKETEDIFKQKTELEIEINELREIRAKSDIESQRKELINKISQTNSKIDEIENVVNFNVNFIRNNTLKWNANINQLEEIKNKIVATEINEINAVRDLIKYLENINENNFSTLEISAVKEIKTKLEQLIRLANMTYFQVKNEYEKDKNSEQNLEKDIDKLKKGINPYESELINFKCQIENNLKEKTGKDIKTYILADLLEIKDEKWQNAIEGYLNTQKKYLIVDPIYFEETSKIYRQLAKDSNTFHSFGIVDIEKVANERIEKSKNCLADEVTTKNDYAKIYIDYLLGRVIKCETVEELRKCKIGITPDCMLYQGYVLRKINPKFYKYPSIGKDALEKQKVMKENELTNLKNKIYNEEKVIKTMGNFKEISNFSENDIENFNISIRKSKDKIDYLKQREELQKEYDNMDMFWLNEISDKIKLKEELRKQKEEKISENKTIMGKLSEAVKIAEYDQIPEKELLLQNKCIEIDADYSKNWQETVGEDIYGKEGLKRTPEKIQEIYTRKLKHTFIRKEETKKELETRKSDYNTTYQLAYNIHDGSNEEFAKELKELREIALPEYLEKIEDSKKKAYEQFRIEFLDKLKSNIDEVRNQIKDLNIALSEHRFGTDTYSFKMTPKQEYKRFYNMITDDMLLGDWGIGQEQFNQKYNDEIKELFNKITTTDLNANPILNEEYEKNIKEYTDYRTYLSFDLIVKDKKRK